MEPNNFFEPRAPSSELWILLWILRLILSLGFWLSPMLVLH